MGNAARLRKKQKREQSKLDKPMTITMREVIKLAENEANILFEQKKKEISDTLTKGISCSVGYIVASALEEKYGFGKKRAAKGVITVMQNLTDLCECGLDIIDHMKYWNDKGLYIEENEKNELVVRTK